MASNDSAFGITTQVITVGASLVANIPVGEFVSSRLLNWSSGSSCYVTGISTGVPVTGYGLVGGQPISIGGPAPLWLSNTNGVTTIVHMMASITKS